MTLSIKPVDAALGAVVTGVDLACLDETQSPKHVARWLREGVKTW